MYKLPWDSIRKAYFCRVSSPAYSVDMLHLADAFIQSDLQCIQVIHVLSVSVFPGNWTHNLCAANAMLYHWDTGTLDMLSCTLHRLRCGFGSMCQ